MRFYIYRPISGEQRDVRKFTLLPVLINNTIYWLEWITVRQSYNTKAAGWSNDWVVNK